MSIVQTVAMATNNRKDKHFFATIHQFASFSRVSFGKISWNSVVLWKLFRTILQFEKIKNLSGGFLKILQFPIFYLKKKKSFDKIVLKNYMVKWASISWSIQTFTKFHQNETRVNWARFLRLHVCDVIPFWDDHARMRIRDPLKPMACSKF